MKRNRWIAIAGALILILVFASIYAARRGRALGEFQFLAPYIVKDTTEYSRGTIVFRPGPRKPDNFVAERTITIAGRPTKELFQMMDAHFTRANGYVLTELPASDVDDPELMIEPYHSRPFGPAEPGLQQIIAVGTDADHVEITVRENLSNPQATWVRMTHPGHDPFSTENPNDRIFARSVHLPNALPSPAKP